MRTSRGSGLAGGAVVRSGEPIVGAESAASPARPGRPLGCETAAMVLLLGPPSGRRHPAAGGGVSGVFEEVRPGRAATALTSAETASRRRPLLGTANATAPARETQSNAPGLGVPGPSRGSAPPRRH